jgi:hypothetical protein
LVALRYGPLIYNVERADQPALDLAIGPEPLTTEWRGDLLQGVVVLKGKWRDGSPLLAIPNFARNNRAAQAADGSGRGKSGGNASIDYSGDIASPATNAASASAQAARPRQGHADGPASTVWFHAN